MTRNTTLLELVDTIGEHARTEGELIATVIELVNSGRVSLYGTFRGARFDPQSVGDL